MDTDQAIRRSALIGVRDALTIGVVVGYVFAGTRAPGDPPALGVGLSAALLTLLVQPVGDQGVPGPCGPRYGASGFDLGAIGLAAGSLGAAVGALIG